MTNKKMGAHARGQHGAKGAGSEPPGRRLDEFDIADELKGTNSLQGNDQGTARSERQAQAGADGDPDELLESFKKTGKHYRAAAERTGGNPDQHRNKS